VVLCFDLTSVDSFEKVNKWKENFMEFGMPKSEENFPFVLIGNKLDLAESAADQRQVETIKAIEWCKFQAEEGQKSEGAMEGRKSHKKAYSIPYFEVSAKTGENMEKAFMEIARLAYQNRQTLSRWSLQKGVEEQEEEAFLQTGLNLKKTRQLDQNSNNGGCACYYS